MRETVRHPAVFLVCLLAWSVPYSATLAAEGEEVPLYTNADLERFPALPDSEVAVSNPTSEEWRFVTDYLTRQYSRLDADRKYSMERERAEAETELIRRRANRQTYGLPVYWNRFDRWGPGPGRDRGDGTVGRLVRASLPDGQIRPLHAGPTRAQIDYFKATRRSGADAFPDASRVRSKGGGRRR